VKKESTGMMEIQEAPLTRAESVVPPKKKPFSRTNPTLQALVMPAGPTKLSDAIERKDREKPDTIATEHIESLLAEMDDDNTGYVERGQFRRYVKRKGWPISDDKIDEMFDEADGNGDGRLDFLELQAAASGRFKKRIHKHEWFNFLSAVAEMLSGTQNVFELPIEPAMQVDIFDAHDMAPDVLTFRPQRFGGVDVPERVLMTPANASARPNAAVAIATLDSFMPAAGAGGMHTASYAEKAINQSMESKVSMTDRADVRQFYPPPERDDSPQRAFDMSAALGRSMAPLLGSHYSVAFDATRTYDSAVRGLSERSEASKARAPQESVGRPAGTKQIHELMADTREWSRAGEHYLPNKRDTLVLRKEGTLRGGVDDETKLWESLQHTSNEGVTPSLELLERRQNSGKSAERPDEKVAREQKEKDGFSTSSLLHRPLLPTELRAKAAADARNTIEGFAQPKTSDWLNGKPSPHSFREQLARTGKTLDGSGRPDLDLVSRPTPSGGFVREAMRDGPPMRLQQTQNAHPSSQTKAQSGAIRGQWAEQGKAVTAAPSLPRPLALKKARQP